MNLIQKGFECDYEMNIFINIFFEKSEDGTIITDFCHENDLITVKTEIEFNGEKYDSVYEYPFKNSETDPKIIKKIYSCSCTKSFIRAAKKIRDIELPWGVMSGIRPAKSVRQFRDLGKSEEEIREILKFVYEVSDKKIDLAMKVAENEKIVLERIKEKSVSIYIGIPFCPSRCLYCSFVSTDIKNSGKYMDEFSDLLCLEIKKTGELLKENGFFVQNIYIGGGTPTTLSCDNLEKIFKSIKENINLENLDEFTLEAGRPDTITYEKMELSKKYGVNRLSINPQTMHDETLVRIGRKHSVEMFLDAFKIARDVGFDNINTDLIAGLPGETFNDFKETIDKICEINPEDVTVHSMCVKRAARLKDSGEKLTNYEIMNKMLDYASEKMAEVGKEPYYMYRQKNISGNLENVGYSGPDHMSSYNINIMEEAQTIIALGGGGSSKIVMGDRIERVVNFKEPYEYIRRFDEILTKKEECFNFFEKE